MNDLSVPNALEVMFMVSPETAALMLWLIATRYQPLRSGMFAMSPRCYVRSGFEVHVKPDCHCRRPR